MIQQARKTEIAGLKNWPMVLNRSHFKKVEA
jgi:hypothetical protein